MSVNNINNEGLYSTVSLLKDLKHVNIVTLHDIIHTDQSLTLIFEYVVMKYVTLCIPVMLS